ncbi:hypothetical protein CCP2SC5_390019 [Azospirillaceae bacterium]
MENQRRQKKTIDGDHRRRPEEAPEKDTAKDTASLLYLPPPPFLSQKIRLKKNAKNRKKLLPNPMGFATHSLVAARRQTQKRMRQKKAGKAERLRLKFQE